MELLSITPETFQGIVEIAARTLKKGGVIIAPTDTVYGLVADATNESAMAKIYGIKEREPQKALPIFVKNMAMAKKIAAISPKQQYYLEQKWPGKTTAVLKRNNGLKIFGVNGETIALRIPFYPFMNSLLETYNLPLAGTSANISGFPASTKIDDVLRQFADKKIFPDLAVNAGDLPDSKPSTIIDLTLPAIKIIRP